MRAAELIARRARRRAADQPGAVARRRGDALRRRHPQGARPARLAAGDAARRGHPARRRVVPRVARRRIPRRTGRSSRERRRRARSSTASSSRGAGAAGAPGRRRDLRPDGDRQDAPSRAPCRSGSTARSSPPTPRRSTPGIPVLTAAPDYPARLVGIVAARPTTSRSASTSGSRTQRSTRSSTRAARRSSSAAPASTCARRSRRSSSRRRPRRASASAGPRSTTSSGPDGRHALLAERDPAAAARVHPNDRRRVVRALELAEAGVVARAGPRTGSGPTTCATRRCSSGSTLDPDELDAPDRGAGRRAWSRAASSTEARAAWAQPLSATARKVLGLEEFATLPLDEAVAAVVAATRRLAALPAQVASPAPGRRYARRRPPTGGARR